MLSVLLVCFGELVRWCVGAVNGLGYCKRRKRDEGGIEEKKKVLRIGMGFSY